MPLIEYRCRQCARVFERLLPRANAADITECPECGEQTGKRLLSLVAPVRADETDLMPAGCCGAAGCACGR